MAICAPKAWLQLRFALDKSLSELAGWSGQLDRAMCESFAIGVTVSTLVPALAMA